MASNTKVRRQRIVLEPRDEALLRRGLDNLRGAGDFVSLRTRAFVLLLLDGAVRTKHAVSLNAEDVVSSPASRRIIASREVAQPPREDNKYRELRFFITDEVREALTDYLKVVRRDGCLPASKLEGPLFLSTYHRGTGQRLTRRAAIAGWDAFQMTHMEKRSQDYSLDDLVYTGRKRFVEAAGMDSSVLSKHTGLSRRTAAKYLDESPTSPGDVIEAMNKRRKQGK